ncbi:hypothetical protein RND71_011339 [Anisodus tanguticus]|uniref:RING-type E3 ubiquitin transferase n=1 Tax=Anisodus tanguticus TaxID=243964 RepID=A0AAE1SDJ9_9SOLA|nr:hypothetical protein RND71_011339 [Anisodus tanguticus]
MDATRSTESSVERQWRSAVQARRRLSRELGRTEQRVSSHVSIVDYRSRGSIRSTLQNEGPSPPATRASIEALPIVEEKSECAICLVEFQVGEKAKEMPCRHRYHSNCINKWLLIHGSCPVCRYRMPRPEETAQMRPLELVTRSNNLHSDEESDFGLDSFLAYYRRRDTYELL